MADTGKRMAGPAFLASSAATLYTVPASTTTILRYLRLNNTSASAVTVNLSVGADAAATRFVTVTVPASSAYDWTGMIPLATSEYVQGFAGTASVVSVVLAGVEIT